MDERDWLAHRFDANRTQLKALAYRMLGSLSEADDAVQESWFRLSRTDISAVENLDAWMRTVVSRVCLDVLRTRATRREESLDQYLPGSLTRAQDERSPEDEALLAESVGIALLVLLDTLTPAERLAFVLHDVFAVPFDEIAPIVGRSSAAARQLASRARRQVQGANADLPRDLDRQRDVVDAFLAASRRGDFAALLAVLDPDVVLRVDAAAAGAGAAIEVRGATAVAGQARLFSDRSRYTQAALVNGAVGIVVAPTGRLLVVFEVTVSNGRIAEMQIVSDPARLRQLDLKVLPQRSTDHLGT